MQNQTLAIQPKSKAKIIEETVLAYADPSKRAYDPSRRMCYYLMDDGRKCAAGRYLKNPDLNMRGTVGSLYLVDDNGEFKNSCPFEMAVQDDATGHEINFWLDIQEWHDKFEHFTDDKISDLGWTVIENLINKWCVA